MTYVVAAGLTYGAGENIFHFWFKVQRNCCLFTLSLPSSSLLIVLLLTPLFLLSPLSLPSHSLPPSSPLSSPSHTSRLLFSPSLPGMVTLHLSKCLVTVKTWSPPFTSLT